MSNVTGQEKGKTILENDKKVIINGKDLDLQQIIDVARNDYFVELSDEAKERVIKSRNIVDKIVDDEVRPDRVLSQVV